MIESFVHRYRCYVSMRVLLASLLIFSFSGFACELTPEYSKLRAEVSEEIRDPYNSCTKAARAHFFYKAVAKCREAGRGKNIGGGCFHIAGYEVNHDEGELDHCKILKPTTDQFIEYLNVVAKEKGIEKCQS